VAQRDFRSKPANLPHQGPSQLFVCLQLAIWKTEVGHAGKAEDRGSPRLFSSPHRCGVAHASSTPASGRAYREVHFSTSHHELGERAASEELGVIRVRAYHEHAREP
jgi:hypothetical protein